MADSFELLRARVVIDVSSVKAATNAVAGLQVAIKRLEKPIKLDVGKIVAPKGGSAAGKAAKEMDPIADQLKAIQLAALEVERSTLKATDKLRELARLRRDMLSIRENFKLTDSQALAYERAAKSLRGVQQKLVRDQIRDAQRQAQAIIDLNRRATADAKAQAKIQEQARLQSIQRVIRAAQKAQIVSRDPKTNDAERTRLLSRAEELLIRVRQRVAATSREAIQIERQLIAVRRAAVPAVDSLAARLRALANITAAASNAPGLGNLGRQLGSVGSRLLFAAAQMTKLSISTAALTFGIGTLIVGTLKAVDLLFQLGRAAINAASAIGRAALTTAVRGLGLALSFILTPIRAATVALRNFLSIPGLRQFITSMVGVAASMEQARSQLRLAFGDAAQAEFARLRAEADLFGSSIQELTASFSRFALAAQGTRLTLQDVRNLFTGVQAAARVNAISTDALSRIFRALEQISTKGALRSEELVQQLGDALPAATRLAAKALGFQIDETQELIELMRKGEIQADRFLKAFGRQLIVDFFEKAVSLTDTLSVRLARLRNAATLMSESIGQFFSSTLVFGLERIVQAAVRMRAAFAPIGGFFTTLAQRFQKSFRSFNIEALFERIAQVLRGSGTLISDFLKRLATIGIVFNGAALIAGFVAIKALITAANDLMGRFLAKIQKFSGIDLSTPERAFAAVVAALDVLPLLLASATRIWIHFKQVATDTFGVLLTNIRGLIKIWAAAELFKNPARALGVAALLSQVDRIVDAMRKPAEDGSLTDTIAKEIDGMLKKIAKAQANLRAVMEGEDGKGKNPAADAINEAAENLGAALKGETGDILGIEDAVRRLNSAGVGALKVTAPEVEKKQQEDIARTAINTDRMVALLEAQGRLTPFIGRGPGLV